MRTGVLGPLLACILLMGASSVHAADSGFVPPTSVYMHTDFDEYDSPFEPETWQPEAGSWRASGGTYNNAGAAPTALTVIAEYYPNPNGPPTQGVSDSGSGFYYRARIRSAGNGASQLAGVVYNYVDAANYYEALFSNDGRAMVRRMLNGTLAVVASTGYQGGGTNIWFDVEVAKKAGVTTVSVNGLPIITALPQSELSSGRLGLITHYTAAKFDKVSVARPFGPQPFREQFSSAPAQYWSAGSAGWSVANGTFNSTAVRPANMTLPMGGNAAWYEETLEYTLRARMLNPYRGSGNLVGMYFHESIDPPNEQPSWGEIVFSPTGTASLNLYYEGTKHTVATAPYKGAQNKWFDVRLDAWLGSVSVSVDGVALFREVSTTPLISGNTGLITHWSPGKFDDVWYDNTSAFYPLSSSFDDAIPDQWMLSGTWATSAGVLSNSSPGASDTVATACACWKTDFAYRARLLNQYGAAGNLVGLVYNYQRLPFSRGVQKPYVGLYNGDYYEVVFAPTGTAHLNKVINGARYRVATASHSVPRNAWFDVQVLRQGTSTTVKLNGTTLFNKVPQAELGHGDVGVIAHWSKARFDDLEVREYLGR